MAFCIPRQAFMTAFLLVLALVTVWPGLILAQALPFTDSEPAVPEEKPATVARELEPGEEQAIKRRLDEIFSNLEGLDGVQVEVRSGVVELSGEVLSTEARQQAGNLARRVEGVVEVENRITEVRDVQRRLTPALQRLLDRFYDAIAYLPLLGIGALIVLVFWFLGRLIGNWDRLYHRLAPNRFLRDLLRQVVRGVMVLAGILLTLEILGATALLGTVLGAAGLFGLAVGFAVRDTVENYIASILLSIRQPFAPNDQVLIEGYEGRVMQLTSRATTLITLEGNHVRIPNATVFKSVVVNYTRNPKRRFDFTVGVDTEADLLLAQRLAVETLQAMAGVLDDPPPMSWIQTLGDSNVVLWVIGWVDQRQTEFIKVRSEAIRLVKEAFDTAGLEMPEPIYNLRVAGVPPERIAPGQRPPTPPERVRPAAEPRVAINISRDTHLDRQVAEDRVEVGKTDLLDPKAPKE